MFYVYSIQNNKNLKLYIGFSNNYEKRWKSEIDSAFNSNHGDYNTVLSRSLRKHSKIKENVKKAFTFQVIEEFETQEDAKESEMFWIEFLRTNVRRYGDETGMNLTDGADGLVGFKHSQESKKKMSASRCKVIAEKGNHLLGFKHTEESKNKMSTARIGRFIGENSPSWGHKHSKETKVKMSAALKGKLSGEKHPMYGKTHTKESRRKISENHADLSGENHPCAKLNWNIVNKIRDEYKYDNISQSILSQKYNISKTAIGNIVHNRTWKI